MTWWWGSLDSSAEGMVYIGSGDKNVLGYFLGKDACDPGEIESTPRLVRPTLANMLHSAASALGWLATSRGDRAWQIRPQSTITSLCPFCSPPASPQLVGDLLALAFVTS